MSFNPRQRFFTDTIRHGFRPTVDQMSALISGIVSAVRSDTLEVEAAGNELLIEVEPDALHRELGYFLANITGHADLTAGSKWKYAWSEIGITDNDDASLTSPRSGTTTTDFALNLVELNNGVATAVGGDGVNPSGADYPSGYARRPVGSAGTSDTHTVDVPVMMFIIYDTAGARRYVFSQPNMHDGIC